jgi:hypothetical protein
MSHVADGILHAYLDGALGALGDAGELPDGASAADVVSHLNACADCRSRLEAERAIREGAGVVLNDASLSRVTVPPLADIGTASRTRRARWLPMSWAASVLLALGAGWLGSEVWRTQGAYTEAAERAVAEPPAMDSDLPPPPEAAATDAPEAGRRESVDTDVVHSDAAVSAPVRGQVATESLGRTDSGSAAPAAAAQPIAPLPQPPVAAVPLPATVTAGADAQWNERTRQAAVETVGSLQLRSAVETVKVTEPVITSADTQRLTAAGFRGLADIDSLGAREQSGRIQFAAATPADLSAIGEQLFIVAGASAPSIEVAKELGQTAVRVRQTLQTGERVELISLQQHAIALDALVVTGLTDIDERRNAPQRNGRAEPPSDSAGQPARVSLVSLPGVRTLTDGRQEVVLRSGSSPLWILVRADLGAEALRVLTSRLTQPVLPAH